MPRAAKPTDEKPTADAAPTEPEVPTPPDEEEDVDAIEAHRREVIARAPAEEARPQNITGRLAQITGYLGVIKKTGRNTFHNYRYAKEGDLVEEVRPLLAEYGIRIHQSLFGNLNEGFIPHQRMGQMKKGATDSVDTLTVITMVFWFEWFNPKSGAVEKTEPQYFMGYGDDPSDKGIYKAFTGCEKYFLMKTFLVATGDDPEGDPRADQRASARDAETSVEVRRGGRQGRQTAPGGRQDEQTPPQSRELGELLRQAGVRKSEDSAALLGRLLGREIPLDPDDKAGSFKKAIDELNPREMGKLIFDLRKHVEGLPAADPATNGEPDSSPDQPQTGEATTAPQGAVADSAIE